mgnify:CR=1 FL=1
MYDLVVIGSGPGGYVAAIKAAQMGMDVACVEKYDTFGGTCLNVGCIPSKAMLEASHKYVEATDKLEDFGVMVDGVDLDLDKMLGHKEKTVGATTKGIEYLFNKYGVEGLHGLATIVDENTVEIGEGDDAETVETENIIIATGSKPAALPGVDYDKEYIVDSTGALEFDEVPDRFIVIGGGYIGLEMGSVWSRLGAETTVLEFLPRILSGFTDDDVATQAERLFTKQGMEINKKAKVTGAEVDEEAGEVTVTYEDRDSGETEEVVADRVLVAVGRTPYTEGLGLENVGLETDDRGFLEVDDNYETDVDGIYALGDVTGDPLLAHKAEEEGVVCVERMNGVTSHINYEAIPGVVYTHPEIAAVGKLEEQLDEEGVDYNVGKFNFRANARARALNDTDGYVKVLADAETDKILGAQMIGVHAGDLIPEIVVGMEFHGSSEDQARASHPHPSLSEIVKEAALDAHGEPLNS